MSSKRRLRRKQCEGKVRHPDRDAALAHIFSLVRKGKARGLMSPYKCRWCGAWHMGHKGQVTAREAA